MAGRIVIGEVVRVGLMAKTITVKVERHFAHKEYGKRVRKSSLYHVHDEEGLAQAGEFWSIEESPKFSKTKHWRLGEKKR